MIVSFRMNAKLRDLDNAARIWAMENTNFPISSHIPLGYTEKLAELIVQECAKEIRKELQRYPNGDLTWRCAMEESAKIVEEVIKV